MCNGSSIIRERQGFIRRELDRRNIPMKAVAGDSGIPYPTLLTYFPQDRDKEAVQIPGGAIYSLVYGKAMPDDLLSMLLPDGAQIIRASEDIDHDAVANMAHEYLAEKTAAHHPDSPDGPALSNCEKIKLSEKAAGLKAVAA